MIIFNRLLIVNLRNSGNKKIFLLNSVSLREIKGTQNILRFSVFNIAESHDSLSHITEEPSHQNLINYDYK